MFKAFIFIFAWWVSTPLYAVDMVLVCDDQRIQIDGNERPRCHTSGTSQWQLVPLDEFTALPQDLDAQKLVTAYSVGFSYAFVPLSFLFSGYLLLSSMTFFGKKS